MTGKIVSRANYNSEDSIRITDGLWLALPGKGFLKEDRKYIQFALSNISDAVILASPYKSDTLIKFEAVDFNLFDYQSEGLVPATYQWISEALKIETPEVKCWYNKHLKKYEFDFLIQ